MGMCKLLLRLLFVDRAFNVLELGVNRTSSNLVHPRGLNRIFPVFPAELIQ